MTCTKGTLAMMGQEAGGDPEGQEKAVPGPSPDSLVSLSQVWHSESYYKPELIRAVTASHVSPSTKEQEGTPVLGHLGHTAGV